MCIYIYVYSKIIPIKSADISPDITCASGGCDLMWRPWSSGSTSQESGIPKNSFKKNMGCVQALQRWPVMCFWGPMVPCSAHECAIVDYPHRLSAPPHATDQTPGTLVKIKLAHIAGCSWIYICIYFPSLTWENQKFRQSSGPSSTPAVGTPPIVWVLCLFKPHSLLEFPFPSKIITSSTTHHFWISVL